MKKHSRIYYVLYIGILIIVVSSIINITYLSNLRLDEPVFFKHYYEMLLSKNNNGIIDFYYLTNADDNKRIVEIYFPYINGNKDFIVRNSIDMNYKYYNVKKFEVIMPLNLDTYSQLGEELNLRDAVVYFSNGNSIKADLGKIIIKKDDNNKKNYLDNVMTSASSNNTSKCIFKVKEPIIINSITTNLLDETKGQIKMKIVADDSNDIELIEDLHGNNPEKHELELNKKNKEEVESIVFEDIKLPIPVKSMLNVYTEFNINEKDKQFNFYRVLLTINYETMNGEKGIKRLLNVNYNPFFTDENIRNFLKVRGIK